MTRRPPARQIGRGGTVARAAGAVLLLTLAFAGALGDGVSWVEGLSGFVGVPAGVILVHAGIARMIGRPFAATGGLGFCLNLGLGAALFSIDATRELTAIFAGASLLLAAARGYAGCEVLAVSNVILGRNDQVGCVVFSPLDELESRLTAARVQP